ncbi:MAG: oligopeptide/dipeptide ABC transporter ATP-binding protein [Acidimicrobiia bacterium]
MDNNTQVKITGVSQDDKTVLLRVDDLHKTFYTKSHGHKISTFAVRGVSLSIQKGETLGVVGESGCGKTTLARMVAGLDEPTRGVLSFLGHKLKFDKRTRKMISMVFQDPYASLNPRMSTASCIREPMHLLTDEELDARLKELYPDKPVDEFEILPRGFIKKFFLRFESKRRKKEKAYAAGLIELVQLRSEWALRYPHEFSGGQRQRIGIARALATSPELLILDEPVSALDVSVQAGIITLLRRLKTERELAMMFISHDLRIVKHLCDRVVVMYLGQVMEDAPAELLFANPRHPYTRALMASIPKARTEDENTDITEDAEDSEELGGVKLKILKGELPSPTNPPKGCPFRTRCEKATEKCEIQPPLAQMTDGRQIACHFPY